MLKRDSFSLENQKVKQGVSKNTYTQREIKAIMVPARGMIYSSFSLWDGENLLVLL